MSNVYREAGAVEEVSDEERLAALVRERDAKAEARAVARKSQQVSAAIADTERALKEDELWAQLEDEHGIGNVRRINTPHGMVVVKGAPSLIHRRFADEMQRSESANANVRRGMTAHDAAEHFAKSCRVYPDQPAFVALCEKVGNLVVVAAAQAYEIGKAQAEDDAGK